jgi:acetyl-CoA synthetase
MHVTSWLWVQVSSVEIERVCVEHVPAVAQAAAIAVPPSGGGPDQLHLFLVIEAGRDVATGDLLAACQRALRAHLNPLFKLTAVSVTAGLPRNASNKVMRRVLRDGLLQSRSQHGRL